MVNSEILKAGLVMRIAYGIVLLVATLWGFKLWSTGSWISTEVMVGAGLGALVVSWIVSVRWRNRQRRRLMHTRDSALW
jgi:uncharacterized membrane protein